MTASPTASSSSVASSGGSIELAILRETNRLKMRGRVQSVSICSELGKKSARMSRAAATSKSFMLLACRPLPAFLLAERCEKIADKARARGRRIRRQIASYQRVI